MQQSSLSLTVDTQFLARLISTHLAPYFAHEHPRDEVTLREMTATLNSCGIMPIIASNFTVTVNSECVEAGEVAVEFCSGGDGDTTLLYITEHDQALGEVTPDDEFAVLLNLASQLLAQLIDKGRSCSANPRLVALGHTQFQTAFDSLRRSTRPDHDTY